MDNGLIGSLLPKLNEDYLVNETQSLDRQKGEIHS